MAKPYPVCTTGELPPGERRLGEAAGRSIGVFNVEGRYYALRNRCPHQAGPLCLGKIEGTMLPSEVGQFRYGSQHRIIRCPWHGWEFDVTTGESVFQPRQVRLKKYPVTVEPEIQSHPDDSEQPKTVETFPVTVEKKWIIVHA